jgi:PAS domain S-box-containing protein
MSPTSHRPELDLLRRQVADLAHELAERDRVLHEQTRHLEVAQALAHLGSWNWDIASGEMEWSDELYRIFGYEPRARAITFDSFVSAMLPDDHDRVLASIDDALAGATAYDLECRIVRPDGDVRTIHCCGEVARDSGGQPLRMSGTALDITDRKRTEAMLRTSQERLRQALHASGTGLWDWNTETNDVVFSEEWKYQLGYEPAEIADSFEAWTTLLHPEDRDAAMAYVRDYLSRREGDYRQEFRLKHKDGEYRWIEARASFVTEADGRQIRLLGSHTDITDRTRMEESVRESEERYRTLVELSPSGVFVFSEGRTVYVNPTGAVLMGAKDAREILDRPTFEFIHPDYHQDVRENVKRLLSGGVSVHSAERIYLKMDGTPIQVQVEAARITWNGKPAILGLFSDITERKRGEDRMHEMNLALVQAMPGISRVDLDGRYREMNQSYAAMLGYEPAELLGQTWEMTVYPEDLCIANHAYEQLLEKGKAEFECRAVRKDGSIFFKQVLMVRGQPSVGGVLGHHCFMRDITERKQTEETVWKSRQAIRALHDISSAQGQSLKERVEALLHLGCRFFDTPIGMETFVRGEELEVGQVNAPGMAFHQGMSVPLGKTYCSETLCQSETLSFEHAGASPEWQRHPAYAALKLESYIGTVINGQECTYGTLCFASVEPREKRFTESERDFIQLMARWLGGELDRQSALDALRRSEERYRTLYDETPSMYFTIDGRGIIQSVNQYGAQYLGYRVQDLVGKSVATILFEDDQERIWAEMDAFFRHPEGVAQWEFRKVRSDGMVLWVREFARVLQNQSGESFALVVCDDITERKQAGEALRASEERFAKAFQAGPYPVVISELDSGLVVDANDAASRMFGYCKEEVEGRTTLEMGLWPSAEARACFVEELKRGGSVRNVEVTLRSKNGEIHQCLVSSELIELNGRQCCVTVGDDITESKRLERALRLTQFSVDQAVEAIMWLDPNARIFSVNDTACRMLEYSREQLLAMTVHDIDPNFPVERWVTHWNYLKQQGALIFDARFWSRSGSVLQTDVTVNYLQHEGKEYACMILRDVAERKRAEAELHRSHMFLRQVIDTDPDLIFAKGRDGRFTVANKAVADWYGTTVEELIGKSDSDFNTNAEEVEFFRHNDHEVFNSGMDRFIPEERLTDAEGKTRWLQTVKRPIYDDQGQVHMVLGAATDITERKRMEEILVQRERDLSAALQERERISQDLHDGILQSLYAVGLGLEACKPLIRKRRDHVAKKFMVTLDHAISQLNQVMSEVRNFIAGLESQVLQGGDFSTALRTMVETMSISSSTRCRVRIDDEAARRLSTEQALHIINIVREGVSNALRHSRAKQITVSLRDLIRSDRLAVTDDGIGFSTRSAQGVGHGLVNMAARAQKVRGLFAIQSKPDKGTRISLDLPKDTHYAHN